MSSDNRWQQRFNNYNSAFTQLKEGVDLLAERNLSDLEKEGLVQRFEYTQELSWKLIKDYLEFSGVLEMKSPKAVVRQAINIGLIKSDLQSWMDMIEERNVTSHTYDSKILSKTVQKIVKQFYPLLAALLKSFDEIKKQEAVS